MDRRFVLVALFALLMALAAVEATAAEIPFVPGAVWTYEAAPPFDGTRIHAMGALESFHGMMSYPVIESLFGIPWPRTHWAPGDGEQALLRGADVGYGGKWYFSPSPVFADPALAVGESITTTAGVYEVTEMGDQWYGYHAVTVTCLEASTYDVPGFGTLPAVTLEVAWPDSPGAAPWTYGRHEVRTYASGIGLVRIVEYSSDPTRIWNIVQVINLDLTAAPHADVALALAAAPTPFNPATEFTFRLPTPGRARLDVHDLRGRHVAALVDRDLAAGSHAVVWQPRGLASGVYVARLVTGGGAVVTTRVTLLE